MKNTSFNARFEDFPIGLDNLSSINSSQDLPHTQNDETQLDKRNNVYTTLLSSYCSYLSASVESKKKYKFWVTVILLSIIFIVTIGSIYLYYLAVTTNNNDDVANYLSIITIFISFIGSIIIIPMQIIKYIFNENEIQQIGEIIKNIQVYDKAIRDDLYKVKIENIKDKRNGVPSSSEEK